MATFTLDYESIEQTRSFAVLSQIYDDGSEERRLKHRKPIVGFRIMGSLVNPAGFAAYQAFYDARLGGFETFVFNSPFDGQDYDVVFDGELGCQFEGALMRAVLQLRVVNQDEV